ncbi:MAG: hypothetical protein K9H16_07310 [Bacteroidales bacterium]|nr:hypothetical protein [Bacteroidales bacterium]
MKATIFFKTAMIICLLLMLGKLSQAQESTTTDDYIVLTWNDLGMHCANKDFSKIVVLPPYNNLISQLIKKGSETAWPEIVTADITIGYEVPGNTYSIGKTNFWDYEDQIFGVNLPDNIGLTGAGLSGEMEVNGNAFTIEGIPITPYTDANLEDEDPFQLTLVQAYDGLGVLLASTQNVIPVSNEINCVSSGCHSSENDILNEHEIEGGFDPSNTPILCASCHSSNALGTPGTPGLESLSEVIHDKHKDKTNDCYKCHPGPNTQCQRGVMHAAGMVCQDCHGSVANVAQSIKDGREPWLEEPGCGTLNCHGSQYAEEPGKLYRNSKGHGGLYCSACHGSPHALVPSTLDRDNVQNVALQGYEGVLNNCAVCHGYLPAGPGPHGISAPPTVSQQLELNAGWNSISSYLIPLQQNVEDIFSQVTDDLIIMQSDSGFYWPAQDVNTIGNWNAKSGYVIKVQNDITLPFTGIEEADKQISVRMGWTILPVLSPCNVSIESFLAQNQGQIKIIKDIADVGVFWPDQGIFSLTALEPGKSYYIFSYTNVDFVFPVCQ